MLASCVVDSNLPSHYHINYHTQLGMECRFLPQLVIEMWAAASSRAEGAAASRSHKITHVQLDGLVLLKIVKHCKENFPEYVAGALLGLDVDDTLQVTHR